ncbi:hypothetical protein D3C77_347620 [compost metagenome]
MGILHYGKGENITTATVRNGKEWVRMATLTYAELSPDAALRTGLASALLVNVIVSRRFICAPAGCSVNRGTGINYRTAHQAIHDEHCLDRHDLSLDHRAPGNDSKASPQAAERLQ